MLLKRFPNIKNNKFSIILNRFLNSIYYPIFIAFIVFVSATFGAELVAYWIVAIISVLLPSLFCEDMKSIVAPLAMCYCSLSFKNNNTFLGISCFKNYQFLTTFIICACFIATVLIVRAIFDIATKNVKNVSRPSLALGILIFSVSLLLGGLFSTHYTPKNIIMTLAEIVSLFIGYFYIYYFVGIDDKSTRKLMLLFEIFGVMIFAQIIVTYIANRNWTLTEFPRDRITTGWGIHTTIGGIACMFISVPFYFIIKGEKIYAHLGILVVLLASLFLAQSRGPIIVGVSMLIALSVLTLIKGNKYTKTRYSIFLGLGVVAIIAICIILKDKVSEKLNFVFSNLSSFNGLDEITNGRLTIYKNGLNCFASYPILGTGWFSSNAPQFTFVVFPPRWHNTIVQFLATGGVVALLAYGYHRYTTIKLVFTKEKKLIPENGFLSLILVSLLVSSLFDCFLFNIGPGLIYGIILGYMEVNKVRN